MLILFTDVVLSHAALFCLFIDCARCCLCGNVCGPGFVWCWCLVLIALVETWGVLDGLFEQGVSVCL